MKRAISCFTRFYNSQRANVSSHRDFHFLSRLLIIQNVLPIYHNELTLQRGTFPFVSRYSSNTASNIWRRHANILRTYARPLITNKVTRDQMGYKETGIKLWCSLNSVTFRCKYGERIDPPPTMYNVYKSFRERYVSFMKIHGTFWTGFFFF